MQIKIMIGLALSTCLSLQGCAGFKGNTLAAVNPNDLKVANNTNIKIYDSWTFETANNMIDAKAKEKVAETHKKNFEEALRNANCCILVSSANEADLVLTGKAIDENNMAAMLPAIITGFSLYTIPSWATSKVHIVAKVQRADKNYDYELQDHMTMVQWLPMAFAFPFANPFSMEGDMNANTSRTLVARLKADGVLE